MFLIQNKIRRGVPPISVSLSAPGPLVSALPSPGMPRAALGQHDHAPHPRHKGAGRPRRCPKRRRRHRFEAAPPPRYWSTSRPRVSEHATPSSPPGRALPPPVRSLCSPLIHRRASLLPPLCGPVAGWLTSLRFSHRSPSAAPPSSTLASVRSPPSRLSEAGRRAQSDRAFAASPHR
jgi:hypothetical protein